MQEISKKYILIPKLQPTNESSVTYVAHPSTTIYNPLSVSNDADWRNKYHILDELKKIEKEGSSDVSREEPVRDNFNDENEFRKNIKGQKTTDNIDLISKTQQKNDQRPIRELQENSDYNVEIKSPLEHATIIVPNAAIMSVENKVNEEQKPISDSYGVNQEFYSNANNENVNFNQVQDTHQNEMKESTVAPKHTDEVCDNDINEPVIQNTAVEPSEIQTDNSNYYTTTFSEKDKPVQNLKNDEVVTKPMETNPSEEPYATEGENMPISENIQQQEIVVNENVIPSQIDEFEDEQKEMFYSENAEYNQNSDSVGYTQNEDNTNEQYSYYNESQQEQPYFAEINEHEESTERYDPNYAQQYAENYEDNVNAVQYENQQYGVDNYENQTEAANVYYEQQPDQLDLSNAVYEQQPDQQEMTDLNYGQQPVNYEYEQPHLTEQSHVDNMNAYDPHASEHVNYETQQYNGVGEADPTVAEQNVYENPQEYVQNTEQDTIQNVEQHLDQEEGYIETENVVPIEPAAELENISDPNVKET